MSYTDDSSDQEWKEEKPKRKKVKNEHDLTEKSGKKTKYYQRFCEKWMTLFSPWLARCEDDLNKPFCRACQCRLDSNRCHLQRHARTFKHERNLEILISKGESAARENLSIRQERSKYYQQRKKLNVMQDLESTLDETEDFNEETRIDGGATSFQFVQTDVASADQYSDEQSIKNETISTESRNASRRKYNKERSSTRIAIKREVTPVKKDRNKLLMQIQKDKSDIMDSFKELISNGAGISLSRSPPREKNHVDLFFDSVGSSVKALTPKLIAEAKMRVSQLICELELRALTEADGTTNNVPLVVSSDASTTYVVNSQVDNDVHQVQEGSRRDHYGTIS